MTVRTRLTPRGRVVVAAAAALLLLGVALGLANPGAPAATASIEPLASEPQVVDAFTATATVYGPGLEGGTTASGEAFNPHAATAAHPTLEFGTRLRVTHLRTGDDIEVVVNDRLPDQPFDRIDLTVGAGQLIGLSLEEGVAAVRVEVLGTGR